MKRGNHYFWRKLHSLSGVIPVGGFLIFHLTLNSMAFLKGPEAYNSIIKMNTSLPLVTLIEWVLIFLPLYYHAIYGIVVALDSRNNVLRYQYFRNWMFYVQRVSGVFTLFFVTWHIYMFTLQRMLFGHEISFNVVAQALHNPLYAVLYALGVTSAAFHFANGLWTFLITWGITVGPRAQRISYVLSVVLFAGLTAAGLAALYAFSTSPILAAM